MILIIIDMLQQEMYSAMKNKNKLRKDTIAALIGAINKTAIIFTEFEGKDTIEKYPYVLWFERKDKK